MGAELFHADGQTDMTKQILAFRNFVNTSKNERLLLNSGSNRDRNNNTVLSCQKADRCTIPLPTAFNSIAFPNVRHRCIGIVKTAEFKL